MAFKIRLEIDKRYRYYNVEKIFDDSKTERYKIIGNNGSFELESNRPYLRNKGLKHKRPEWKAIGVDIKSQWMLDLFINAIMKEVD